MLACPEVYAIPQGHRELRDTIRTIAIERIAPRASGIDARSEYPSDLRELLAEQDILALPFEPEYGGTGRPISAFQGIQFKLADMETQCAAARELLYQACAKVDRGDEDIGKYSAMAKLFCSDAAMRNTVEAVQVLGGYGYVQDYPVERMLRDAKITQIYEGTNEIQRLVISRALG